MEKLADLTITKISEKNPMSAGHSVKSAIFKNKEFYTLRPGCVKFNRLQCENCLLKNINHQSKLNNVDGVKTVVYSPCCHQNIINNDMISYNRSIGEKAKHLCKQNSKSKELNECMIRDEDNLFENCHEKTKDNCITDGKKVWDYWDPNSPFGDFEELSQLVRGNLFPGYTYNFKRGSTYQADFDSCKLVLEDDCGSENQIDKDRFKKKADQYNKWQAEVIKKKDLKQRLIAEEKLKTTNMKINIK